MQSATGTSLHHANAISILGGHNLAVFFEHRVEKVKFFSPLEAKVARHQVTLVLVADHATLFLDTNSMTKIIANFLSFSSWHSKSSTHLHTPIDRDRFPSTLNRTAFLDKFHLTTISSFHATSTNFGSLVTKLIFPLSAASFGIGDNTSVASKTSLGHDAFLLRHSFHRHLEGELLVKFAFHLAFHVSKAFNKMKVLVAAHETKLVVIQTSTKAIRHAFLLHELLDIGHLAAFVHSVNVYNSLPALLETLAILGATGSHSILGVHLFKLHLSKGLAVNTGLVTLVGAMELDATFSPKLRQVTMIIHTLSKDATAAHFRASFKCPLSKHFAISHVHAFEAAFLAYHFVDHVTTAWTPKFGLLLGADSLKTTKLGHVEEELELLILLS